MLKPRELSLDEMGDLADIIPGPDPELKATIRAISQFEADVTRPIIPVSYTHLRAHETVLDLVCRLLLEKKKNKL